MRDPRDCILIINKLQWVYSANVDSPWLGNIFSSTLFHFLLFSTQSLIPVSVCLQFVSIWFVIYLPFFPFELIHFVEICFVDFSPQRIHCAFITFLFLYIYFILIIIIHHIIHSFYKHFSFIFLHLPLYLNLRLTKNS